MRDKRQTGSYYAQLTAAALALRLVFVLRLPVVEGDSQFYGDLAKNWLKFGILGSTGPDGVVPSLVRLPGYPAFLAAVWSVAGIEHYRAVLLVQVVFDLGTCFLIADIARRVLRSEQGARIAFLLAALCPFTANYTACALTETLTIFFTALALDLALLAWRGRELLPWAACGLALAAGILLRPDSGILLAVLLGYMTVHAFSSRQATSRRGRDREPGKRRSATFHPSTRKTRVPGAPVSRPSGLAPWLAPALVLTLAALAPLLPWTVRNWRDFRVFQPLAPRYANTPTEYVPHGWERWEKTWMADYVSVEDIDWAQGDELLDIGKLPNRAFDTPEERRHTSALFDIHNRGVNQGVRPMSPELDGKFAALARERIRRHPWRYYVFLPALRIADMWLRPRTEMLRLNTRWWEFDPVRDSLIAMGLGAVNLFYVAAGAGGVYLLWRKKLPAEAGCGWGLLLAFVVTRSLFLGTLENPEPRYTLECLPAVMVFAAAGLAGLRRRGIMPETSSALPGGDKDQTLAGDAIPRLAE